VAKFAVILPAAGSSTRFRMQQKKKTFVELEGRAVWLRSAEHFVNRDDVCQTIVVVSPDDLDWFKEKFAANLAFLDVEIVAGGAERFDSVRNGLARVRGDAEFVAVHDAARPLLVADWITSVFKAAERDGAALLATPVTSTLKRVDSGRITETVSRAGLWAAQTPQVARRDWLLDAFARQGSRQPTDECQLLEAAGYPVTVVEGSALNIKITTESDFRLAEAALHALPKPKFIRPLHPFADENEFR
jgi:2-C-methyl-D-erythritol 4-phosphate cytidylyltransferase